MADDYASRPVSHGDLDLLTRSVDQRFMSLEKWIERCTTALEKLVAEKEQVAVLAAQNTEQNRRIAELEERTQLIEKRETDQEIRFVKFDLMWAGAALVGSGLVAAVIRFAFAHVG